MLPALAGLFVGAPLLARELEHGTYRFAWTQGVTRRRWLLSKTALLAVGDRRRGGRRERSSSCGGARPSTRSRGGSAPSGFDIEGIVVPAYALFALALGVLAGLASRRTVAAMTATLVAFARDSAPRLEFLRPHFMAPLHRVVCATDDGRMPATGC